MAQGNGKTSKKKGRKKSRPLSRSPLGLIEEFTERDLEQWALHSISTQQCVDSFYFDLERQRVRQYDELCAALSSAKHTRMTLDLWIRVTDYQWSLRPLCASGSLRGIGGRFNIGRDLTRARRQEFPVLYIAQDLDTAFRERFGGPLSQAAGELSLQEFALRRPDSFTTFALRGHVNHVFDLRDEGNLAPFVKIISKFSVSKDTLRFFRKFNFQPPTLIRTTKELLRWLLAAPDRWRGMPQLFATPAPSQIFGRLLSDAGFEAVLYPSQRGGTLCMAVFPENFKASDSKIEVSGAAPAGANCTVLDKNNLCRE